MNTIEHIHEAAIARLVNDGQLSVLLGRADAIHDRVPLQRRFPFVTITDVNWTDWSTDTLPGYDLVTTIRVWSRASNRRQLYRIADRITQLLSTWHGTVEGTHIVLSDRLTATFERDPAQRAFRATLRFRQLIEPTNP